MAGLAGEQDRRGGKLATKVPGTCWVEKNAGERETPAAEETWLNVYQVRAELSEKLTGEKRYQVQW